MNDCDAPSSARPPAAVIVSPAWHSCGSYEVFRAQIRAFESLGYKTFFLAVPTVVEVSRHNKKYWKNYSLLTTDLGASHRGHTARSSLTFLNPSFFRAVYHGARGSIVNWNTLPARLAPLKRNLQRFIEANTVELVFCNHFFNMPLAERIRDAVARRGKTPKLVLETHDLQSNHYLSWGILHPLFGTPPIADRLIDDEVAIARRADALVHLNEDEHRFFLTRAPERHHALIHPPMPRRWRPSNAALEFALDVEKRFDFLIVASSNIGNYRNLCWFLDQVWSEEFNSRFNLKIAGGVDWEFVLRNDPRHKKFRKCFVGRVEKLDLYYHNCRAVLLPVVEGQGIAIKTIEALSFGKPVVATPLAFRGFERSIDLKRFPGVVQDARGFRAAISDIGDGVFDAISWDAVRLYESIFSEEKYIARYADFFELAFQTTAPREARARLSFSSRASDDHPALEKLAT